MTDNKLKLALLKIISDMVECPAGSFMMGSPKNEYGRNSRAFYFDCFKAIDILLEAGTIIDDENFMLIKNRINISCFEPSEKIKLLKRLYQAVGKVF